LLQSRGLTAVDSDALVFVDTRGGPLRYSNWRRRAWEPACEAAGLKGLHFHDLRSMAASALIEVGANVKTTQTRMRHGSPAITLLLYTQASAEADRRAAEAVGEFVRGNGTPRVHGQKGTRARTPRQGL